MRWAIKSCQESSAEGYDDEWTLGGPPNGLSSAVSARSVNVKAIVQRRAEVRCSVRVRRRRSAASDVDSIPSLRPLDSFDCKDR